MVKLLILMILLVFSFSIDMSDNDIDYEDIYDINDYEYPYNHINRSDLV